MKKIIIAAIYFISPVAAFAVQLIVPFPESPAEITDPGTYIKTIYNFGIGIAGLLAMAQIVFGGVQYTVSAGDTSRQSDAKGRIWSAITGLILLLASYLILFTINPKLVELRLGIDRLVIKKPLVLSEEALLRKQHEDLIKLTEAANEAKILAEQGVKIAKKFAEAEREYLKNPEDKEKLLVVSEAALEYEKHRQKELKQNLIINQQRLQKSDQFIALSRINLEQQTDKDLRNTLLQNIQNAQIANGITSRTITQLKKDMDDNKEQIRVYEIIYERALEEKMEEERLQK